MLLFKRLKLEDMKHTLKDICLGYQVFVCQEEKDVTNTITKDLRERGGGGPRDVYVAVGGSGTINEVGWKPFRNPSRKDLGNDLHSDHLDFIRALSLV